MPRRVAVIGAGPAGLVTLRHLSSDPGHFSLVAFDKQDQLGGLWNYSDRTDADQPGDSQCPASIYKSLIINFPTVVMNFPALNFPEGLPSFPQHPEVKNYLAKFAEKFNLNQYIKCQTEVINVKPCFASTPVTWFVTTRNVATNTIQTSEHDAVVICNGKEAVGFVPDIPGKESFKGEIIHSKNYRDPQTYKDKVVLIVGASYSGSDIMFDLAPFVPKLYLAHRHGKLEYKIPTHVEETPAVTKIVPNGVILENGECREVDAIIFATGFKYDLRFLSPECGLTLEGERVQPLYRHAFNINHPSMCFVGLIKEVAEFRIADLQARYVTLVLKGDAILPSKTEMLREEEEDYQRRIVARKRPTGMCHNLYHESEQFKYWTQIAAETSVEPYPPVLESLFNYMCDLYDYEADNFKRREFRLIDEDNFEEMNQDK